MAITSDGGRKKNRPVSIATGRQIRSIILTIIFVIVVGLAIAAYCAFGLHMLDRHDADASANQESPVSVSDGNVQESQLNVETAKSKIKSYYSLLSQKKDEQLRNEGFETAANAMALGWFDAIGYSVDAGTINPDVDEMPKPVGSYAGNDVYAISDFFTKSPGDKLVHSRITGDTGVVGWIYYDQMANKWFVIDPTIPSKIQAAASTQISRSSADGNVAVNVSTPGVFSNPWWSFSMVAVDVTSNSTEYDVSISQREMDDGVTIEAPESLLSGIDKGSVGQKAEKHTENENSDDSENSDSKSDADNENKNESADEERNDDPDGDGLTEGRASGVVIIYRGTIDTFDPSRIRQQPMSLDGDMCPVTIVAGDEDISPVISVGADDAAQIAELMNEAQMERYAVNPDADASDVNTTNERPDDGDNENTNEEPSSDGDGNGK